MFNFKKQLIDAFVAELHQNYSDTYGDSIREYGNVIAWVGKLVLENIAGSDMLYHNTEHTINVASVGHEILRGKHLREGGVMPDDYLHFMIALLCHDIGYVRGILKNDRNGQYDTGRDGKMVAIPAGGTDAELTLYHVDRGIQFVQERFSGKRLIDIDIARIGRYIDSTRFINADDSETDLHDYAALTKAADFIGQLGDPSYMQKLPALFYELKEAGLNEAAGYHSPADMRANYAKFFWNIVSPHLRGGIYYLDVTQAGKQWIANLYSQVFSVEHNIPYANDSRPEKMLEMSGFL